MTCTAGLRPVVPSSLVPEVFVSYRRADSRLAAAAVTLELSRVFGADHVFRDAETLVAGRPWSQGLADALEAASVLIALIGPSWLDTPAPDGRGRALDRTDDWVRREIATALDRGIPVIPVLLEDTRRPRADELPEELRRLCPLQTLWLRDRDLQADLDRLIRTVSRHVPTLRRLDAAPGSSAGTPPDIVMTSAWQRLRLEEMVAKAGRRYSPKLHVEVETVQVVEAVGRTEAFTAQWREVLAEFRQARGWTWRAPKELADTFDDALGRGAATFDAADASLQAMITALGGTGTLPLLDEPLSAATAAAIAVNELLREHCRTRDGYYTGYAGSLYSDVQKVLAALYRAQQLTRSSACHAARDKRLVLTGRAGAGKTHLLCDVAGRRIADGRPTLLLLGQDFDDRSLLSQIGELTQVGGPSERVFSTLDAAAQAAGDIGLMMIDALNESKEPERWAAQLRALQAILRRFPHLALVVSCRTEFVDQVVDEVDGVRVEHHGFGEATDMAVARFTEVYGLEPPSFPVLNPEFGNPLYLKLTCEALQTLGATRFRFGTAGLTTVCGAFLEAVNVRLARRARCDYDVRRDLVQRAVRQIALLGRGPYDREAVEKISAAALPGRGWSQSLMRGLISEGVLTDLSTGEIAFGYQRLGDVERALVIAESGLNGVRTWLRAAAEDHWRERGVLGALAVMVPERLAVELADLAVDESGAVSHPVVDSFVESLLLRSPDHVAPRAVEGVDRLLAHPRWRSEVFERLVQVSCIPGHALNAAWLHQRLAAQPLAERDASWSIWLAGQLDDDDAPVRRLIGWAWPGDRSRRGPVSAEVANLAVRLLGWLLVCPDRRLRDRATKAIVSVGERAPLSLATVVADFRGTDDPYVTERLLGSAAAVVLRIDDPAAIRAVADGVVELLTDGWPTHLLIRDFARRVFDAAARHGWSGPTGRPPYGSTWPVATRTVEEIEALVEAGDRSYRSVWSSVTGLGDFGRYVLRTALNHVAADDAHALRRTAECAIFDRVLALGWTPERFSAFDRGRAGGRDGPVERIGKKYQLIALYETLGRITDNLPIAPGWSKETSIPYDHPEQVIWRDVDPTVLVRKPADEQAPTTSWFAPVAAALPDTVVDDYPADMDGVPDPLDLIALADSDGAPWLALMGVHDWKQPLLPEVAALGAPRHQTWLQIHGYLVATEDAGALAEWARGKDWYGQWMPDTVEPHNLLLGAYPDDPRWDAADGEVEWWEAGTGAPPRAQLWQCAAWYGGTGTARDASATEETRGYVPTRRLSDALGLRRGVDFTWPDATGVAVHDPSVATGGASTLVLRRDLVPRLHTAGLTVFWTVLVGKELLQADHDPPDEEYRWISASASYLLVEDGIERIDAVATRCRPGPEVEAALEWTTHPGPA